MRFTAFILILLTLTGCVIKDYAIKRKIVQQASSSYTERCPCPYYLDRAGNDCGERSTYSKHGREKRLCYAGDITDEMVEEYKKKHPTEDSE